MHKNPKTDKIKVTSLTNKGNRLGYDLNAEFRTKETKFEKGDNILMFTDGLIECTNTEQEEYGKRRLEKFLTENYEKGAEELKLALEHEVTDFFGDEPKADDVTFIILKVI